MKSNIVQYGLAVLALLTIGACAGPGTREEIQLTMPGGERATIVAHNQTVPDWMLARERMAMNYVVKGDVSANQLAAVAEAERACRIFTGTVRPSNLVAVLSSGVLYAAAGFVGLGLGSHAFPGAVASQYAKYGASVSGFAGAANGTISLNGRTFTYENCGGELFALFPNYGVRVLRK